MPDSSALLVSFSGIDGAGKSTQIARLREQLEQAGLRVRLVTFWEDVARLKGVRERGAHALFRGDQGVGSPEAPIQRRDKDVQGKTMTAVRWLLYLIDGFSLRGRVRSERDAQQADVVLFDRFCYDELANLDVTKPWNRLLARAVISLVGPIDASIFLDADPEAAFARKPEYALTFLHLNRARYRAISQFASNLLFVEPDSAASVALRISQRVTKLRPAFAPFNDEGREP